MNDIASAALAVWLVGVWASADTPLLRTFSYGF